MQWGIIVTRNQPLLLQWCLMRNTSTHGTPISSLNQLHNQKNSLHTTADCLSYKTKVEIWAFQILFQTWASPSRISVWPLQSLLGGMQWRRINTVEQNCPLQSLLSYCWKVFGVIEHYNKGLLFCAWMSEWIIRDLRVIRHYLNQIHRQGEGWKFRELSDRWIGIKELFITTLEERFHLARITTFALREFTNTMQGKFYNR